MWNNNVITSNEVVDVLSLNKISSEISLGVKSGLVKSLYSF